MKLFYYFSPVGDAYQNLARDEYFLTHLPPDARLLYFYVNSAAVVIGRNQNAFAECNQTALKNDDVQLVRRITGGGAVYHDDGNLNFSFLAPEALYDLEAQDEILLSALRGLGVAAEKNGRNDFVAGGAKFSGNAFGARAGNRVRHGTFLISTDLTKLSRYLSVSEKKLRAKGVSSVRARVRNLCELRPGLTPEIVANAVRAETERFYHTSAETFRLSREEEAEISALREKRASFDWVMGESPAFDYAIEDRFSFGMAQLCLSVADGKIAKAVLYTDALDVRLSEKLPPLLNGRDFSPEILSDVLIRSGEPEFAELGEYIAEFP